MLVLEIEHLRQRILRGRDVRRFLPDQRITQRLVGIPVPDQIAQVDDADDVIAPVEIDRIARMRLFGDLLQAFLDAELAVEHAHVLARRHQRLHGHLVQHQAVVQHLLAGLIQHARFGADIDHRRQLMLCQRRIRLLRHAQQSLQPGNDQHQQRYQRPQQALDRLHRRGHAPGDRLGMGHRDGLRQDLGQHEHDGGHRHGRIEDAGLAEFGHEQGRGQSRGGDVDEVVAQQDRRKHALGILEQLLGASGAAIPAFARQPQAGSAGPGQCGFGAGEKGREQQQKEQQADGQRQGQTHGFHARAGIRRSVQP